MPIAARWSIRVSKTSGCPWSRRWQPAARWWRAPTAARLPDPSLVETMVARHSRLGLALKRSADILVAFVGLALAAPILAVVAVLIRLESGGPSVYRQPRMGRGQRPFTIIKMRTMHPDGRVTRLGRLLRPTGIDELPQPW